jgi:hypothetical protein
MNSCIPAVIYNNFIQFFDFSSKNIWKIPFFLFNFILESRVKYKLNSGNNEQVSERYSKVEAAQTCNVKKHWSAS